MRVFNSLIIMFIGSFFIQYYLMSILMVTNYKNITNSVGKLYLSVIMGLFMVILELMMHDFHHNTFSKNLYLFTGLVLLCFIYLYRNQFAVNDKQYLAEMIEHHSMAVLTSKEILNKTNSYHVTELAKNIIQTQTDEITQMTNLLNKRNKVVRFV